ncbi:hypothetical protein A1O1_04786 [Capronia coronata CBS 617.96]|uniref:EthD domain-containing protein n=1 Tax=Capronia coronata CBS 617.96 TaxID=1182541 RepID=W9Z019_9EURO|nr:uncharacterized protein A1O1_04786 [Capronia coronata CBS 617.96]EXJ87859.1 hypothetical protein A1O1_04786 [Capronia coronata CBS 617.96]
MSSTSSPTESTSTSGTSTAPAQGLLWVTTSVLNKELPPSLLDDWYDEHKDDVLNCPGNGGLFLRYKNLDPAADAYADPKFADRFTPDASMKNISDARWPYLALVKLSDLNWLTSQQFLDMPRVSKVLPREPDGSMGSAFTCWHAGLRSYETVGKLADASGKTTRAKYLLSVQTRDADNSTFAALDEKYSALPGFRGSIKFKKVDGLLEFQEPGALPVGLALYEFDGEEPPASTVDTDHVKADVWELTMEAGDLSLGL